MAPLLDSHNHLHDAWLLSHRERIFADMSAAGVRACVVNGTEENDWPEVAALCRNSDQQSAVSNQADVGGPPSPRVSAAASQPSTLNSQLRLIPSFGLHPWHVGNRSRDWKEKLLGHLETNPHAFVGEIGLDRWILDRARPDDPRLSGLRRAPLAEQLAVFYAQLAIAAERNLPVTIHCIDAYGALLEALNSAPRPERGFLLHAYAGSVELVKSFASLGAYFSFNGYFLDSRRAARLRPVYAAIPADRLLVETDAPAMPLPIDRQHFRLPAAPGGSVVNHPANLLVAYEELARWRGVQAEAIASQIEKNFVHFFCR